MSGSPYVSNEYRAWRSRMNMRKYDRMEREAREVLPEIQMGADGLPYRATIASKSSPSKPPYVLERSVAGRWMHIDSRCPGWTNNGKCYHVSGLEALYMQMEGEKK